MSDKFNIEHCDSEITMEFIYDLHCIVGMDAVTEYYEMLVEHYPHRLEEYKTKLKEYYDTKYWTKYHTD